jgi:HAD superfamily hydrolase (TIGR01549 family)
LFEFIDFRRKTFLGLLKKRGARKLWFRDSKQFIKVMSEKFPVAVVTGSRHLFVNEVFDEKTKKCLRFIITSDDVEHKKPDVEPLIFALRKLKLRKQDVVFVGDSVQDALMCQRLWVRFIAKIGGISTENQLRKFRPLFVAKNFDEIKRFIELFS